MKSMKKKKTVCYGSSKVGTRGQIVLPIDLRKQLNIIEGDSLFIYNEGSFVKIMKSDILEKAIKKVNK